MKEYVASLEKEFSLMENGFKEEEKRALTDYKSNDNEYIKKLAFLAYGSAIYQVRMYGVFLFGYLSEDEETLAFMRDEVSKDDNWRVQEALAKAFDDHCNRGYEDDHSYGEFNAPYPGSRRIWIAYTDTPDGKHSIQYELDSEDKTRTRCVEDMPIKTESSDHGNREDNEALKNMKNEMGPSSFNDPAYADSEDLMAVSGLDIRDDGRSSDSVEAVR